MWFRDCTCCGYYLEKYMPMKMCCNIFCYYYADHLCCSQTNNEKTNSEFGECFILPWFMCNWNIKEVALYKKRKEEPLRAQIKVLHKRIADLEVHKLSTDKPSAPPKQMINT